MNTYIITYDLSDPGQDYNALIERIEGYGTREKIQQSVWLIVTSETAEEIWDHLQQCLDGNDKLFVAKVSAPAIRFLPQQYGVAIINKRLIA